MRGFPGRGIFSMKMVGRGENDGGVKGGGKLKGHRGGEEEEKEWRRYIERATY
jgi:hypothetical protein